MDISVTADIVGGAIEVASALEGDHPLYCVLELKLRKLSFAGYRPCACVPSAEALGRQDKEALLAERGQQGALGDTAAWPQQEERWCQAELHVLQDELREMEHHGQAGRYSSRTSATLQGLLTFHPLRSSNTLCVVKTSLTFFKIIVI